MLIPSFLFIFIFFIIINFLRLTFDISINKFLYPENESEANLTDENPVLNFIKKDYFTQFISEKNKDIIIFNNNIKNQKLKELGMGKYIKIYNLKIISDILKEVTNITRSIISIFIDYSYFNKILLAPVIFIMIPIIVFIKGYYTLFNNILNKITDDNNNFLFEIVFTFFNFFLLNPIVFILLSIKIILHIFTFLFLPFFIIKNTSVASIDKIMNIEGFKMFMIIIFLLFNIPTFITLFNMLYESSK